MIQEIICGYFEYYPMFMTALIMNAQKIVELGTGTGVSTQLFCDALRETGGHLWTVDKDPPNQIVKNKILNNGYHPFVTFMTNDSVEAGYDWQNGEIDILFIDADHSKKSVYNDFQAWIRHNPKVIFWHDIYYPKGFEGRKEFIKAPPSEALQLVADELQINGCILKINLGLGIIIMENKI